MPRLNKPIMDNYKLLIYNKVFLGLEPYQVQNQKATTQIGRFYTCSGQHRTRLEPLGSSENTLEFTFTIAFPQGRKLKHLSTGLAVR